MKIVTALLLVLTLGLHWALLQTVAWTGMIVSYSHDGSLTEAVGKTFDGKHPCCMCKAIESGRKAEQKQSQEKFTPDATIKCVLPTEIVFIHAPALTEFPTLPLDVFRSHLTKPQTPPPRASFAA